MSTVARAKAVLERCKTEAVEHQSDPAFIAELERQRRPLVVWATRHFPCDMSRLQEVQDTDFLIPEAAKALFNLEQWLENPTIPTQAPA